MYPIPDYLPPMLVRVMGELHDYGGALTLWGSWKKYGWAVVHRALAIYICSERANGREVLHIRLPNAKDTRLGPNGTHVPYDVKGIAELAHRCSIGLQRAKDYCERDGRKFRPAWRFVPKKVPPPEWPAGAVGCPGCFCIPSKPCTIKLADGCGIGHCVAAGVFGMKKCSACLFGAEVIEAVPGAGEILNVDGEAYLRWLETGEGTDPTAGVQ